MRANRSIPHLIRISLTLRVCALLVCVTGKLAPLQQGDFLLNTHRCESRIRLTSSSTRFCLSSPALFNSFKPLFWTYNDQPSVAWDLNHVFSLDNVSWKKQMVFTSNWKLKFKQWQCLTTIVYILLFSCFLLFKCF